MGPRGDPGTGMGPNEDRIVRKSKPSSPRVGKTGSMYLDYEKLFAASDSAAIEKGRETPRSDAGGCNRIGATFGSGSFAK